MFNIFAYADNTIVVTLAKNLNEDPDGEPRFKETWSKAKISQFICQKFKILMNSILNNKNDMQAMKH